LPFRQPYVTSRGSLDARQLVLLRIRTAGGTIGLGEAVPMALRGGTSISEIVDELQGWGSLAVEGDQFPNATRMSTPARVAIEMAISDAESKERGMPLHEYLAAGSSASPVLCNATLTTGTPAGVLEQAEAWAADGFTVFKLKVGSGDDSAQIEAVRDGLGPEVKIRIDANGSWTVDEAAAILDQIESFDIELVEQPVADLEGMAALRARTSIPLVADESVASEADAKAAVDLEACDAATVKLSKIGHLDPSLGGHLPTYLSSALDGPVGIAAAAHVAQTLPQSGPWSSVAQGLATERLFDGTIAEQGMLLDGPHLLVPDGNGLGITIDETALNVHRL